MPTLRGVPRSAPPACHHPAGDHAIIPCVAIEDLERLFDALPDVVFFIKDRDGRYAHVNMSLVQRLGLKDRSDVVGRTPGDVYPPPLGERYMAQDRRVLASEPIENHLELQLYPNRQPGWCLTLKQPIRKDGQVVGLIGISRDLGQPDSRHSAYQRLLRIKDYMHRHYDEPLRIAALADMGDISVAQLERHFKKVFQLTPQQLLIQIRIEAATRLLQGDGSIASIGQSCGFTDQSAFARQFKATVGLSPRDYRRTLR